MSERRFELQPLKMEGGGPHGLWYWKRCSPGAPLCEAGRAGYEDCKATSTHTAYTPHVRRDRDPEGFDPPPWPWSICTAHAEKVLADKPDVVVVVGDWGIELKRDPETGVQLRGDGR